MILGYQNVTVLKTLATEQITLKSSVTDSTLRVQFLMKSQFSTMNFRHTTAKNQCITALLDITVFLSEEYQLNVYTSVLYLHPQAGRNDPGYFEYTGNGCEYKIKYRVIRLNEIDGQQILEAQIPSLLPLHL